MKFTSDQIAYLQGEKFSSGEPVEYAFDASDAEYRSRVDWLMQLCRGSSVVHVGCVDHEPQMIRRKLSKGKWVHKQLCEVATRCMGVDINEEGIRYIREELGYEDVIAADITAAPCDELRRTQWDYLVLGEVLEHIDNPVAFLAAIREHYANCIKQMIITVPNAFAMENHRAAGRRREVINTDHRFWFTPYTLGKVVTEAGLRPREVVMCRNGVVKRRSLLKNASMRKRPLYRNGILMVADLAG